MPKAFSYQDLENIFGSKLKADEVLYLLFNEKKVIRQLFSLTELEKVEQFCQNQKLHFLRSKFKILIKDKDEKFSNKGERVDAKDKRDGLFVLYISRDERSTYLAALFEHQNDHKLLGGVLGYPKCCTEYFEDNFSEENPNPELTKGKVVAETITSDSWLLDISKREDDICLLSHFPCSLNCEKSKNIAIMRLELLERLNQNRADGIVAILKQKLINIE